MKNNLGLLDRYAIVEKKPHSDEIVLRDRKTGELALMKEILISTPAEFKVIIETLENQKYLKNDHLISLIDYEAAAEPAFDTSSSQTGEYKVITIYQHGGQSLAEQVASRSINQRFFSEEEIWSILCSAVIGLAGLQKEGVGHGCVTLEDIFLSENGVIKIVDPSLSTEVPFQTLCQGYYYAPEMIEKFSQQNSSQPKHYDQNLEIDIYLADAFSLAMCILESCLLESVRDCYIYDTEYEQPSLIPEMLEDKFHRLLDFYSHSLANILYSMLALDPKERLDFIQLEEQIVSVMSGEVKSVQHKSRIKSSRYSRRHQSNNISFSSSLSQINQQCSLVESISPDEEDFGESCYPYKSFQTDSEHHDVADSKESKEADEMKRKQETVNMDLGEGKAFQSFGNSMCQNEQCSITEERVPVPPNHQQFRQQNQEVPVEGLDHHFNFQTSRKVPINFSKKSPNSSKSVKSSRGSSNRSQHDQAQDLRAYSARPSQFTTNPAPNYSTNPNVPFHREKQNMSLRENRMEFQKEEQIFTDPKLLEMMQLDVEKIIGRRALMRP